jgi:hypothetical protein
MERALPNRMGCLKGGLLIWHDDHHISEREKRRSAAVDSGRSKAF